MKGLKLKEAIEAAVKARRNAYSPYSHFKVGAAVIASSGRIFSGCNVENASYGGTICAERVAITKAISEGETQIVEIVVVTDAKRPTPPCGICRQVMAEFCEPKSRIHIAQKNKVVETWKFKDLLPNAFGPSHI